MHKIVLGLCSLVVAGAPAAALGQAAATPGTYELKPADVPTGSRIRRAPVDEGIVPFDKRYHELTPEQQRAFKDQYEAMPEGDEPPFPVGGLKTIYAALADVAMRLNVEGPLEMHVDIDEKGVATGVSVLRSPRPDVTRLAATVLMLEKYKPAVCGGRPCRMQLPVRTTLRRPATDVHAPFERLPR